MLIDNFLFSAPTTDHLDAEQRVKDNGLLRCRKGPHHASLSGRMADDEGTLLWLCERATTDPAEDVRQEAVRAIAAD